MSHKINSGCRSRISHFKAPFVVAIASSAVSLGCGGETEVWSVNPPSSLDVCPAARPALGTACSVSASHHCGDSSDPCGDGEYQCLNGTWLSVNVRSCNPPSPYIEPSGLVTMNPPDCPAALPEAETECFRDPALDCRYSGCSGELSAIALCRDNRWQYEDDEETGSCEPAKADAGTVSDVDAGAAPSAGGDAGSTIPIADAGLPISPDAG